MASVEEKIEDILKSIFDKNGIKRYAKTENTGNASIDDALKKANSKSGGSGNNIPDIKLVLTYKGRCIPVMIEVKGYANRLEKRDADGALDMSVNSVRDYAVNGAYHYGLAILKNSGIQEVICVGITGYENSAGRVAADCRVLYVSKHNYYDDTRIIDKITVNDWSLFKNENLAQLCKICDELNMSEAEREAIVRIAEQKLEERVKSIHQSIYNDNSLRSVFNTNEKLYIFCGLIMAGLPMGNDLPDFDIDELKGINNIQMNDGVTILNHIDLFLSNRGSVSDKKSTIMTLLRGVFLRSALWEPHAGESILKKLYRQVKKDIIHLLLSEMHLDVTGRILNSINDWVHIDNDKANDVVLTPRYVTRLMVELTRVNMDSYVIDTAMGSGGFLVSAMDYMIRDAKDKIVDINALEQKIKHIKEKQIKGYEILSNIYMLAVLNMILMGDGSSNIKMANSMEQRWGKFGEQYPADVFLLNPPYGAPGNGLNFVEEAIKQMDKGYACVLIQDSCGSGKGIPFTTNILEDASLIASIKMPADLFGGKSSVQTHIYLFKVGMQHDPDDLVTFIDFSEDGYTRSNRKKSTQEVNLKDTDNAKARYAELVARVLGKKAETNYYTEANGKLIRDTITLDGNDWNFGQHQKVDTMPTEDDFKAVVANYLSWKVSQLMKGGK